MPAAPFPWGRTPPRPPCSPARDASPGIPGRGTDDAPEDHSSTAQTIPARATKPQVEPKEEKTSREDASVAMAEAEQVAESSQQASGNLKQNRNPEPVEEKKSGGSFFDQIG